MNADWAEMDRYIVDKRFKKDVRHVFPTQRYDQFVLVLGLPSQWHPMFNKTRFELAYKHAEWTRASLHAYTVCYIASRSRFPSPDHSSHWRYD